MAWFGGSSSESSLDQLIRVVEDQDGKQLSEAQSKPEYLKWRWLCLVVWYNNNPSPTLEWIGTTDQMYRFFNEKLWSIQNRKPIAAFDVDKDRLESDGRVNQILHSYR